MSQMLATFEVIVRPASPEDFRGEHKANEERRAKMRGLLSKIQEHLAAGDTAEANKANRKLLATLSEHLGVEPGKKPRRTFELPRLYESTKDHVAELEKRLRAVEKGQEPKTGFSLDPLTLDTSGVVEPCAAAIEALEKVKEALDATAATAEGNRLLQTGAIESAVREQTALLRHLVEFSGHT